LALSYANLEVIIGQIVLKLQAQRHLKSLRARGQPGVLPEIRSRRQFMAEI
jgi:hypothetical protein